MYRNTLVLPEGDPQWSADSLRAAIENLTVILMLVFGVDTRAQQAIRWADMLAERGRLPNGQNMRHVVWVRNPGEKLLQPILTPILSNQSDVSVVVLNFHDQPRAYIKVSDPLTPIALEAAFLDGQKP
jgi:hypothetical protein